jgi:DNA helicase-2/ATP-dependent DNA helicase PcrA
MTIFDLLEMRAVQRIVSWMRRSQNLWTERTSVAKPQLVTVRDEADQARFIVDRILEYRESGTLLKEQAVLFRTSSHSGPLEIELTRRSIPFVKFGGLKFLDAAQPAKRPPVS